MTILFRFTSIAIGLVVLRAAIDYQLNLFADLTAQLTGAL